MHLLALLWIAVPGPTDAAPGAAAHPQPHDPAAATAPTESAGPPRARLKLAVLDTVVTGMAAEIGDTFSNVLTAEVGALDLYDVISGREIATMIGFEAQKQIIGCTDDSCMAELGGALGVDNLVTSQVALVGSTYVVNIQMLSVREGKTLSRVYEKVKGDVDQVLDLIKVSVPRLFGLQAPPPAATASGSTVETKETESGGVPIAPIVVASVGVVAIGIGVYFGVEAQSAANAVRTEVGVQNDLTRYDELRAKAQTNMLVANVLYGVGGAAIITGVVLFFVLGSDAEEPVAVAPWLAPNAAGASVVVRNW